MGAGQGHKVGGKQTRETEADTGTRNGEWRRDKRRRLAGGGWRVTGMGEFQVDNAPRRERRWVAGVQIDVTKTNSC